MHSLPPVALRGYGTLSGTFWNFRSPAGASILQIDCQSAAKAQIVHAKYVSDLGLLRGVKAEAVTTSGHKLSIRVVDGQGAIAALRSAAAVFILAATSRADLLALFEHGLQGDKRALVSQPEVAVPMYLDRWDKFGFRFYYREWELPPGASTKTYDIPHEFAWARQQDRAGFVFWDQPNQVDTAEGLMNHAWWDWAQQAARLHGLPVAINNSAGATTWLLNRYRHETSRKMPQFSGNFHKVADPYLGGQGVLSWNSQEGKDIELGLLQRSVRRFAAAPNVVSWLEPHGELKHGAHDILLEYGPVADAGYRRYLKGKYQNLGALGARWFGDPRHFHSWNQVRVPELAAFLGWGPQALDLSGNWRVGYEKFAAGKQYTSGDLQNLRTTIVPTEPAPAV